MGPRRNACGQKGFDGTGSDVVAGVGAGGGDAAGESEVAVGVVKEDLAGGCGVEGAADGGVVVAECDEAGGGGGGGPDVGGGGILGRAGGACKYRVGG